MKYFLIILILFSSCAETQQQSKPKFNASSDPFASLKDQYRVYLQSEEYYDARFVYVRKHRDEVMKTLEKADQMEIPGLGVTLIFYRYSIGSEVCKSTEYLKKIDGMYYPHTSLYISEYENPDPFKDGKGEAAKEVLKKIDKWNDDNPWWAL